MSSTKQVKIWKVYVTIVLSIMMYYTSENVRYDIVYNIMKKPGTYIFSTWGEASDFCQANSLPIDDIETVYRTYRVTISKT